MSHPSKTASDGQGNTETLRITGSISEDARVTFTGGADPQAAVFTAVITPPLGLPYRVLQPLGTDASVQVAAQMKAKQLKRGAMVEVHCTGLRVKDDHGRVELVTMNVQAVILRHTAQTHHQ
jgi:hypothetical protein